MAGTAGSQQVYGQYDPNSGGYTAISGSQIQSLQVIANVVAGPPIIINPKTGKPYPPNYIPDEQAPGTHEMWTPGSAMADDRKLKAARVQEINRSNIETATRPHLEALMKKGDEAIDTYEAVSGKLATEFGKDPGRAISNALGIGGQVVGQAVKSGQQLAGQAVKTGQQLVGQAGAVLGGGAMQQPSKLKKIGGMDSASVSVAPERVPERTPRSGSFSRSPSYGGSPSTFSRTPRLN